MASPATAKNAWINHYYCKSKEDYLEKSARSSTLDKSGIKEPSRQEAAAQAAMLAANDVVDHCAVDYLELRRAMRKQQCRMTSP
jgi:hypothetical protein